MTRYILAALLLTTSANAQVTCDPPNVLKTVTDWSIPGQPAYQSVSRPSWGVKSNGAPNPTTATYCLTPAQAAMMDGR